MIWKVYMETLPLFLWYLLLILFVTFVKFSFLDKYLNKRVKIGKRTKMTLICISMTLLIFCFITIDESFWWLARNSNAADLFWISTVYFVLPITIALFCGTFTITFGKVDNLKQIFIIFALALSLSFMASNIHDVVFCGDHSFWYTKSAPAGHDIAPFAKLSSTITGISENRFYDYRILGAYMLLLVIAELIIILRLLRRIGEIKLN